jgi:hypothetical protein
MFQREPGWITVPASYGRIDHYFKEGQSMALCGVTFALQVVTHPEPAQSSKTCQRCPKLLIPKKLHRTKRGRRAERKLSLTGYKRNI